MKRGDSYKNQYGIFPHVNMIGKNFGEKVISAKGGRGWVIPLAPTPELWTCSLKHRTQILYQPDIALVLANLQLKPGSVVLEAGTGSGSLSTSIARTIAPHGFLHTFEFNEYRHQTAEKEFKANGLSSVVKCRHRDVVKTGFPLVEGGVDAVFLDLPTPWDVVPSAARNLRDFGAFCSFSPCIEQVQETCKKLGDLNFKHIKTYEILQRVYDLTQQTYVPPPDNSILLTQTAKERKEQRKREREEAASLKQKSKRQKTESKPKQEGASVESSKTEPVVPRPKPQHVKTMIATPPSRAHGHTGFLTFAFKCGTG
ncbi:hypothetical protein AAMO2058_000014800 [Amorphochlora amoebiformis]